MTRETTGCCCFDPDDEEYLVKQDAKAKEPDRLIMRQEIEVSGWIFPGNMLIRPISVASPAAAGKTLAYVFFKASA